MTTPAPGGWASVTAGGDHTCAIRTNHALWCWGLNNSGQLGLGYYTTGPGVGISIPQQVTSPAAAGWATIAGAPSPGAVTSGRPSLCIRPKGGLDEITPAPPHQRYRARIRQDGMVPESRPVAGSEALTVRALWTAGFPCPRLLVNRQPLNGRICHKSGSTNPSSPRPSRRLAATICCPCRYS